MNAAVDDEDARSPEDRANDVVIPAQDQGQPAPPARTPTKRYPGVSSDDDVSDDDRDTGWGESPSSSRRGDDWYLRERPPHHG